MIRSLSFALAAFSVAAAAAPALAGPPPAAHKTYVRLPDGIRYTDVRVGHGARPKSGQTMVVHYIGMFPNGKKFDSSRDRHTPFEFPLGQSRVIPCWDQGVSTMRVGGRRLLVCPPSMAYGAAGAGGVIPPNATLDFDVELLSIKP